MTLENLMSHIKDKNCIQTNNGEIVVVYSYQRGKVNENS